MLAAYPRAHERQGLAERPREWGSGGRRFKSDRPDQVSEGFPGATQPMTYHPAWNSSWQWFHQDSWLTFNGIQGFDAESVIANDLALTPPKPTGILESQYEGSATGQATAEEVLSRTYRMYYVWGIIHDIRAGDRARPGLL